MDVTTTPNRRQRRSILRFQGLFGKMKMLSEAWSISVIGKATREDKKDRLQLLKDAKTSMLGRRN